MSTGSLALRRAGLAALAVAALLGRSGSASADDAFSAPPQEGQSQPPARVDVRVGGVSLFPQQAGHDVRIKSDGEGTRVVRLDAFGMFVGEGGEFSGPTQQVCEAPCTAKMSSHGTYMVRGWGIADSPHFGINDDTREVDVHTASTVWGPLSTIAVTLGILSTVASAALLPVGYLEPASNPDRFKIQTAGWATLAGGVALIGLGVAFGLIGTTHVYDGHGARLAESHHPRLTLSGLVF